MAPTKNTLTAAATQAQAARRKAEREHAQATTAHDSARQALADLEQCLASGVAGISSDTLSKASEYVRFSELRAQGTTSLLATASQAEALAVSQSMAQSITQSTESGTETFGPAGIKKAQAQSVESIARALTDLNRAVGDRNAALAEAYADVKGAGLTEGECDPLAPVRTCGQSTLRIGDTEHSPVNPARLLADALNAALEVAGLSSVLAVNIK